MLYTSRISAFLTLSRTQRETFNPPPSSSSYFASDKSMSHASVIYLDLSFFLTLCVSQLLSVKGALHSILHLRPIFLFPSIHLTPKKPSLHSANKSAFLFRVLVKFLLCRASIIEAYGFISNLFLGFNKNRQHFCETTNCCQTCAIRVVQ